MSMMDCTVTPTKTLQRSRGTAEVSFRTFALDRLYQSGAAKALLPRSYGAAQEVVLVNTAGGITGGDAYQYRAVADASRIIMTTQAAERAYRSSNADIASMDVQLTARNGASLFWLPQETILFDESRLGRRIEIDLDTDSEVLALESLVFGRHAMGERLQKCHFSDRWRIRRNSQLVHAEALSIQDDLPLVLGSEAGAGGAQMMATLVYVGTRLEQIHADLSAVLPSLASRVGCSIWRGRVVLRLLAAETMTGKADLSHILHSMRGQQVPRVWQS